MMIWRFPIAAWMQNRSAMRVRCALTMMRCLILYLILCLATGACIEPPPGKNRDAYVGGRVLMAPGRG
jgi:hypothetical protein